MSLMPSSSPQAGIQKRCLRGGFSFFAMPPFWIRGCAENDATF